VRLIQHVIDDQLKLRPLDQVLDLGIAARLRVLGVSGPARVAQMPAVPSLREAGFDIAVGAWRTLALPAGSPRPVPDQLSMALRTILEGPQLRAELSSAGLTPSWLGPAETARALLAEYHEAGTLFASLGLNVRKQGLRLGRG